MNISPKLVIINYFNKSLTFAFEAIKQGEIINKITIKSNF